MTEQIAALDALIEAVEAGHRHLCPFWKVWPPESKDGRLAYIADSAFTGSLDAAKALHEALVPGWKWGAHEPKPGVFRVYVSLWSALRPMPTTCESATPARAWLLAILKAYRAGL